MRNCTYFISDLHLGASYITDPRRHEREICRWLRSIEPTAKALYLLGDVLDYWYEYRTVVPRGFTRFFGTLASLADSGVEITWLKGNHDIWIFDYLPSEIGITVADGLITRTIDGKTFVMEHGDGVGEMRPVYRWMRSLFRNRVAQFLFSAIHPRWTVGFAHRWSSHSRKHGCRVPDSLDDNDKLTLFSKEYLSSHPEVDFFVFGHRHVKSDIKIGPHTRMVVLGDAFRLMTYGVWDGADFSLKNINEISENS